MKTKFVHFAIILIHSITFKGQDTYAPVNLGPAINSKNGEGQSVVSADGKEIYFWRDLYRQSVGETVQSAWYSKQDSTGKWLPAKYMGKPFNTGMVNSGIYNVSPDNNTILLRGYFKNGERIKGGFSLVTRGVRGWNDPVGLEVPDYNEMAKGKYSGGFLMPDGKGLIMYLSETPGSTISDLYVSFKKEDGTFTRPAYITGLNTTNTESTPFIASDNKTLYFSSDRPGGLGNNDIWKATRLDDTWMNWSTPQNLGPTINSADWDAYFSLDAKGEFAYMTSSQNSMGSSDIVKIKLAVENKPEPVVLVRGKVLNKNTNQPIEAKISYENLATANNQGVAISNPSTGEYQIALPYGLNYGFNATATGFVSISDNIDLTAISEYKELTRDLYLVPLETGQVIRINNIFFEFAKADLKQESFSELNRLVKLMEQNPTMEIALGGHTDNVGSEESNVKLSSDRAKAVLNYLVLKGISQSRITSNGYGKSKPVVENDTEENRALNRRVEFTILKI
ncbi:MAG: outer membrane protein OmpA family [Bacteroidota bacterium]|jgi:outer membrane protein OmpA-like peptidoglycan-associated protein|nr:outer membrane protein OmpA family [Bacteroidota bacterium]